MHRGAAGRHSAAPGQRLVAAPTHQALQARAPWRSGSHQSDPDFEARFAAFLGAKREVSAEVDDVGARDRRAGARRGRRGARSTIRSKLRPTATSPRLGIAVSQDEIAAADARGRRRGGRGADASRATASRRITSASCRADDRYADALGVELGSRWTAIEAVGLYVPGGTASYPSSVLMNAVPAKVAGVERIVIVGAGAGRRDQPAGAGRGRPRRRRRDLPRRRRAGDRRARLRHRDDPPVAKIVGPGNAYVAAAKRQVFGTVGIDMIAGPSEVLVVADADNDPDWIAADLLAQAEHDAAAQSILITDDAGASPTPSRRRSSAS